jgi:hypothetical protein
MTEASRRHRILLVNEDSSRDDRKAVLDGIGTALSAADRGDVERMSTRHLWVGRAGPSIRLKGEAATTLARDVDPSALLLECLDRPVGNARVRDVIEQALRAMAGMVETDAATVLVEAPTPWQGAAVTLSKDPMRTAAWTRIVGRDVALDPEMEALLPDVVVVGGTLTEMTLNPIGWTGMRTRMLDPMDTLRAVAELRRLMDRTEDLIRDADPRSSRERKEA